ncbi:hypothetical protein PoB_006412400 [Plakobranchus ocellatus]|uniref:Uncharacterized protein n=1 Tax=Plakobranchus ocellatus TaxID=259542 RepID=A0AAV4D0D4_9GAST|nr:hypothetical protein PoB_006412400 [Plakobranchus ocellatus]
MFWLWCDSCQYNPWVHLNHLYRYLVRLVACWQGRLCRAVAEKYMNNLHQGLGSVQQCDLGREAIATIVLWQHLRWLARGQRLHLLAEVLKFWIIFLR